MKIVFIYFLQNVVMFFEKTPYFVVECLFDTIQDSYIDISEFELIN